MNKNKIPEDIEGVVRSHRRLIPNGIIHRITDIGSPVIIKISNTLETRQFNNWFRNSKTINKDSTPKVLSRWTNKEFTAFNTSLSGENKGMTHGDGKETL